MSMLTVEECDLLSDAKYRSYIIQVEKVLRNFEHTSEWPDLISALGQLNKVLLSHLRYPVIPKKMTVAKCLAQCLHPSFPGGVHLKTLETYDIIFKCIGTQRLAHDLFIYSAGLFPLLGHAAMNVKPVLLTVYETHFISLGQHIKPGLNGLLLGLLPGLVEGAEFFDRTNMLLEDFCNAVGPAYFYTCVWECMFSCPNARLCGVLFLLNHLNKLQSMEDQLHIIGQNIDLMVSGICACLQDASVLVQRNMLDFLLNAFPLHSGQLMRADMVKVVEAAVSVVLRRDMSLNRRLYAWLLGKPTVDPHHGGQRTRNTLKTNEMEISYFKIYSKDPLVSALKSKLLKIDPSFRPGLDGCFSGLKPLQILINLMDKVEIGPAIIEDVLLSVFRLLEIEGNHSTNNCAANGSGFITTDSNLPMEINKAANLLFASFHPNFIWNFIACKFSLACTKLQKENNNSRCDAEVEIVSVCELCHLTECLLDVIALDVYPETTTEHLPNFLRQIILSLTTSCDFMTEAEVTITLKLCSKILSHVQPSVAEHGLILKGSQDASDNISVFNNTALSHNIDSKHDRGNFVNPEKKNVEERTKQTSSECDGAHKKGIVPLKSSSQMVRAARQDDNKDSLVIIKDSSSQKVNDNFVKDGNNNKRQTDLKLHSSSSSEDWQLSSKVNNIFEYPVISACISDGMNIADDQLVHSSIRNQLAEECSGNNNKVKSTLANSVIYNAIPETVREFSGESSTATLQTLDSGSAVVLESSEVKDKAEMRSQECSQTELKYSAACRTDSNSDVSAGHSNNVKPGDSSVVSSLPDHRNFMQLCFETYQQFFHQFCQLKILTSDEFCARCINTITAATSLSDPKNTPQSGLVDKLKLGSQMEDVTQAYSQACRLLVDFAGFPIFCTDSGDIIEQTCSKGESSALPHWLQDLLICSCFVDSFEVESVSISSLLDLVMLTQSVQNENEKKRDHQSRQSFSEGRISVVILPALLPIHLDYINRETIFYQVVASALWQYMSEEYSPQLQRAAELFHTLHQVAPSASICEDVIGHDLISESEVVKISAFKKFSVLWHLTRSIRNEINPSHNLRSFDRSMFVVLDSLKEESSITKTLALTWLTHVIQRGDMSRVLQPLLLMLLHPDTARISIQHMSVDKPPQQAAASEKGQEDVKTKIDAIDSRASDIMYTMSQSRRPQLSKNVMSASEDLKSSSFSEIKNKDGPVTSAMYTYSNMELSFTTVDRENGKLRINLFGSESSLDKLIFDGCDFPPFLSVPGKMGMTRLNDDTCKKKGVLFDNSYIGQEDFSEKDAKDTHPAPEEEFTAEEYREFRNGSHVSSEDVARWILDGTIFSAIVEASDADTHSESGGGWSESGGRFSTKSQRDINMERSYISPTLDDLQEIDGDNVCYTETDENKNCSHASENLPFNLSCSLDKRDGHCDLHTDSSSEHATSCSVDNHDPCVDINELHKHMLLYTQQFDCHRVLYAMSTLRAILHTCPRLFVTAMSTTSISSMRAPHFVKLQSLLARHYKSLVGKGFLGDLSPELITGFRSNMFVEIVISLCQYFVQSYYPDLMANKLTREDLLGNRKVHIVGLEILTLLMSELLAIMKDSGRNFVSYISDLLSRCKLQRFLLHSLLASVYNQSLSSRSSDIVEVIEKIIDYNENGLDPSVNDTFQKNLLQLILVMIMLEYQMYPAQGTSADPSMTTGKKSSLLKVFYNPNHLIIQQEMFLRAVWSMLRQHHHCYLHCHWIGLVTSALPYMGQAMAHTVLCVVLQLCHNLEIMVSDLTNTRSSFQRVPPDYIVSVLEGLATMCHYCLLENANPISIGQPLPTTTNIPTEAVSAGQILTNLIHVFNPAIGGKDPSLIRDSTPISPVLVTRERMLSILPRIMACMATLWKAVSTIKEDDVAYGTDYPSIGDARAIRHQILELLSPISVTHGTNFLAAFAVAWNDHRLMPSTVMSSQKSQVNLQVCNDQLLLVELVGAIKVLPTDTLIQTVKQVIKQPPHSELSKDLPLDVNLLQFFLAYVHHTATSSQLLDSWPSLLGLLRECLQVNLSPPAVFLLLQILNEFVQKALSMEEKKNQKDLQDICQKTLESIGAIAGSSLEQTTWLRKNFAVKPGPQNEAEDNGETYKDTDHIEISKEVSIVKSPVRRSQVSDSKYSVQALLVLAELTTHLLDVVYGSDEKNKVAPFLTALLHNVFPYLRHHSAHNVPSYRACSQLLSSISGYPYTRRSWRREAFEIFVESSFFQMDISSIGYWRVIIDNLMTHDKTTFKDLMGRVSFSQTGSLNLFNTKEQEYELQAQMMKRLAFTIFCSEADQYQRAMPEIQERLAECLRLPQVANVMSSVFLCFRVLILRMSPQHLTSLWPTIITEMVQVLLQIEQELSTDTEEFNRILKRWTQIQRIAALDSSWAHLGNGLNAHNNPAWLQLYLNACKLLDMCLVMPAGKVPQFQLYRWAFVGTAEEEDYITEQYSDDPTWQLFMPHINRLSHLLNNKLKKQPLVLKVEQGRPLLTLSRLRTLSELQPFFYTLCHCAQKQYHGRNNHRSQSSTNSAAATSTPSKLGPIPGKEQTSNIAAETISEKKDALSATSNKEYIEHLLEIDFLESLSY